MKRRDRPGREWPGDGGGTDFEPRVRSPALTPEKPPGHSPTRGRQRPGSRFGEGGRLVPPPPAPPFSPPRSGPHPAQTAPDGTSSTGRSPGASDPRGTPPSSPVQPPARPIGEWPPTAAVASQLPPTEPRSLTWPRMIPLLP